MARSQGSIARISKSVGTPFGGINSHDDPRSVGISSALQAQNVILLYGRIKAREGFKAWNGDWDQIVAGQIEGLHAWLARDFNDDPALTFRSFGIAKVVFDPVHDTAAFRVWNRDKSGANFGWGRPINLLDPDANPPTNGAENLSPDVCNFQAVGQSAKLMAGNNMPEYDTVIFILDRSARAHKTNGVGTIADVAAPASTSAARVVRVGLAAPSIPNPVFGGSIRNIANPGGFTNHPTGVFEFVVSVVNEALNPNEEYGVIGSDPGLESNSAPNAVPYGAVALSFTTPSPNEVAEITCTCPDPEKEPWTAIRVYRRQVNSAPEESTFRHVWTVGRASLTGYTFTVGEGSAPNYTFNVGGTPSSEPTYSIPAAAGPFAFAPLRNFPPQYMSHFAKYRGRGWYARNYENKLYFSDIQDPLSGGNIECISNEFIGPFSGPITLLAQYFNSLVIGTPTSLAVLNGVYRSKTNQDTWTGNTVQNTGFSLDETDVERGPIMYGVGNSVEADQVLYYVSREGLEAYNGRVSINVSRPIFADLATFADDAGGNVQVVMQKAQLSHDPTRNIIYMLVRRDIQYATEPTNPVPGIAATYVKSRVYCYHYRESDPENNNLGRWTVFDQVGPGSLDETGAAVNLDRRDRYSSIAMRPFQDRPHRLCLGHRAPTDEGNPGVWLTYRHAVVLEQDPAIFADSHLDGPGGNALTTGRDWRWQSGRETFGLLDLYKRFWSLRAQVASASAALASLKIGFSVDGGADRLTAFDPTAVSDPAIPIGWTGRDVSIIFAGTDSSDDAEVSGFSVDLEPVG